MIKNAISTRCFLFILCIGWGCLDNPVLADTRSWGNTNGTTGGYGGAYAACLSMVNPEHTTVKSITKLNDVAARCEFEYTNPSTGLTSQQFGNVGLFGTCLSGTDVTFGNNESGIAPSGGGAGGTSCSNGCELNNNGDPSANGLQSGTTNGNTCPITQESLSESQYAQPTDPDPDPGNPTDGGTTPPEELPDGTNPGTPESTPSSTTSSSTTTSTSSTSTSSTSTTTDNGDGTSTTTTTGTDTTTTEETTEETPHTASGLGCDQPLVCDGDAIQCAVLAQVKAQRCASQPIPGQPELGAFAPEESYNVTVDSVDDLLDDSGWLGAGVCPSPYTTTVLGATFTIEFDLFCQLASIVGALVIFTASIISIRIIA